MRRGRLVLVPDLEIKDDEPSAVEIGSDMPSRKKIGNWMARIVFRWPKGVEKHPGVDHQFLRRLDRICGVARALPEHPKDILDVSYGLTATEVEDVEPEAEMVLAELLGWLGLNKDNVIYKEIIPLEGTSSHESGNTSETQPDLQS